MLMPFEPAQEPVHPDAKRTGDETVSVPVTPMSIPLAVDLILCGGMMIATVLIVHGLRSDLPGIGACAAVVVGSICIASGVLGARGRDSRQAAVVAVGTMALMFAIYAWRIWGFPTDTPENRLLGLLMAVMSFFCTGTLSNLINERRKNRTRTVG